MMRFALSLLLLVPVTPAWADADDDAAVEVFRGAFGQSCTSFAEDGSPIRPARRHDVKMPVTWGEPEQVILWQFRCDQGAYNSVDVFLLKTEYDGIRPVALARPEIKAEYVDPEDSESAVKAITVIGWGADATAINAGFDPATGMLTTHALWRGLGDAYSDGTWVLKNGGFVLVRYEVDASYDGEIAPQLKLAFP
ncbi:DUF1176 domain-containing protein [Pseudogemmobacter blasticus]|nr:DUF1176 domain-containing protein [Fuscovulum blasticum]